MEIDFDTYLASGDSDGCSGGLSKTWKRVLGTQPPFEHCCQFHDYCYFIGGNWIDRIKADFDLFLCVKKKSLFWAMIIFLAVRLFGAFNFIWKWNSYSYTLSDYKS